MVVPYRLVFEDAVANLKAIWHSTQRLEGGEVEFLNGEGTKGGIFENWLKLPRLMAALPSTAPFPYVLEFLYEHRHIAEFIVLNKTATNRVLDAWCSKPNLLWLRSIPFCGGREVLMKYRFYSQTIKSTNSVDARALCWIPRLMPERCQPMNKILGECDLTRAAWSTVVPLNPLLVFTGVVCKGFQRGGTLLGCPTANIHSVDQPLELGKLRDRIILFGTYSAEAVMNDVKYSAIASLGMNPVFKGTGPTLEVHLFSIFEENFYDAEMTVTLTGFLRPEATFRDLKELVFAIQMDCEVQNQVFAQNQDRRD